MMWRKAMSVALLLTVAGCMATPPAPRPEPAPAPAPAPIPPPPIAKPKPPQVCASETCIPERIYFDEDSARIVGNDNRAILTRVASYLKTHPKLALTIEGHAEERGTREYNLSLGEQRAVAVRKALQVIGVHNKIDVISYGNERPAVLGDKDIEKQNRRAVLVIQ